MLAMTPGDPLAWIADEAARRRAEGLERRLNPRGGKRPGQIAIAGAWCLDLASNDYLGLASDPRLATAAAEVAATHGTGAGASALVAGWTDHHHALAAELAAFEGAEAALVFPSGFAANLGSISALVGPGDAVYHDRLNHACLVAGTRLAGATLRVYPHGDPQRLHDLLTRERNRFRRVLIATDGVFSMDGDVAPLTALADIAARFDTMLLVDEAHGTGVLGPRGRGACDAAGLADRTPIRVGTLSKALGTLGGFVAGPRSLIDHVLHRAGPFVYSTSLPPPIVAAARVALQIVQNEPHRRTHLAALGERLRAGLIGQGWPPTASTTPIVPVILGDPALALDSTRRLLDAGILAPAIRPPTVPRGTSRLRLSLSAAHAEADVDRLLAALADLQRP